MNLIVTEKPNAAQRISTILSNGSATKKRIGGETVYSWQKTRCIGLVGHVVEVDFPEEYNDWREVSPSDLVDIEIIKRPSMPSIVSTLQTLAKDADTVTIATDFDREGELIGLEAYELVQEVNETAPVERVRFSSLTDTEVSNAFENQTEIDFDLAAAGEARQYIDLRWGASLTRFLTLASQKRREGPISVGRVQTPTLKLVVDREREIENFDPEDFWEIVAGLRDDRDSDPFEAQHFHLDENDNEMERIWNEERAEEVHSDIQGAGVAQVTGVTERTENDHPPIPFDTTEFISAANAIGYDAKPAMSIAEDLYNDGYITYPRTDNTVYPDDLEVEELLQMLSLIDSFEADAEGLLEKESLTPTSGDSETTDHPPIHPTENIPPTSELSGSEWEIYELVVRRFFATLADPARWDRVRIDVNAAGHKLKANGKQLIYSGYHAVYPYFDIEEAEVPRVSEGESLNLVIARLDEKQTRPPNRYGQSQLIEKMEKLGLGTKSTRHNTIDKLYDRGYIHGKPPTPSELARNVITAMEEHAPHVVSESMTSQLEEDMSAIADGEATLDKVTKNSRDMLGEVFDDLRGEQEEIGGLLDEAVKSSEGSGEGSDVDEIGPCPECSGSLFPRESQSGSRFIGCTGYPGCDYTLPLPNTGRPHVLDDVCAEHNLHHIKMIAGKKTFTYGCPQCQKERADQTDDRIIGECPECGSAEGGDLAIKRVRNGSRLVGCTRYPDCDYSLPLPREGDIELTDRVCDNHGLPELAVHKDGSSVWELGCPICNYKENIE